MEIKSSTEVMGGIENMFGQSLEEILVMLKVQALMFMP